MRANIYERVLMIIKFLATDPMVQHANITQLIVIKKEHKLIKSRRKPDVYKNNVVKVYSSTHIVHH